jgi:hypothetical protein
MSAATGENAFSRFKEGENIQVDRMRRVQSSWRDKWRSMGKKDAMEQVLGGANIVVPVGGLGLAIPAAIVASVAVAATGIGVAGLGVALAVFDLAYHRYSNREGAHAQLSGHVWSLIDDVRPEPPGKSEDLAAASLYLLREGVAQLDEMRNKLTTAVNNFDKFWSEYENLNSWLTDKAWYDPPSSGPARAALVNLPPPLKSLSEDDRVMYCFLQRDKAVNLWNTANEQNGAVFELMRRLNHLGNYLQAPMIVASYLADDQNAKFPDCIKDQFNKNALVKTWRDVCYHRSDQLKAYEANYKTFVSAVYKKYNIAA